MSPLRHESDEEADASYKDVIAALMLMTLGDTAAASRCLERISRRADGTTGAMVFGAAFTWATTIQTMGEVAHGHVVLDEMPGATPTPEERDRATALAAFIGAVINDDERGACELWYGLTTDQAYQLAWDALTVAAAVARKKALET